MQLNKLELYGFKSFAERTVFNFAPGITAFVGPNGCGKSNVVDAIRWVLGEQNPRAIRANKMEDVFFAGSLKSDYKNYAEVNIILDNSNQTLAIDYSEISITRRLYRSGESEYFLNRVPCRLKDIQELLASASLGKGTYAIIGQGQVEAVINSKPEDRRLMFEEAAGITLFKIRKRDAFKKLADTRVNLTRLEDIIHELEGQQSELSQSATKARSYQELKTQADKLELIQWANRFGEITSKLDDFSDQRRALEQSLLQTHALLTGVESQLAQQSQTLAEAQNKAKVTEKQHSDLKEQLTALGYELQLNEERRQDFQALKISTSEAVDKLDSQISVITTKLHRAELEGESHHIKIEAFSKALNQHQQLTELVNRLYGALETYVSRTDTILIQAVSENAKAATDQEQAQVLAKELESNLEKIALRLEQTDAELREQQAVLENKERAITALKLRQQEAIASKTVIQDKVTALDREREECLRIQAQVNSRLLAMEQHVSVLNNMDSELEGFNHGTKAILKAAQSQRLSGVLGAVAQLVKVPKAEHALAVETAFGGALQYLICEDESACKQGIAYLKASGNGRATFIPLAVPERRQSLPTLPKLALATASTLVDADPKMRAVLDSLLGNVIVAKNLDDASVIARETQHRFRIVTLDGDVLNRGYYTGGGPSRNREGLLQRKNKVRELEREIKVYRDKLLQAELSLVTVNKALDEQKTEVVRQEQSRDTLTATISATGLQLQEIDSCCQRLEAEIREIKVLEVQEQTKLAATRAIISSLSQDKLTNQENLDVYGTHKNVLNALAAKLKEQSSLGAATGNRLQLTLLSLKNAEENSKRQWDALNNQLQEMMLQAATARSAAAEQSQNLTELNQKISSLQARIEDGKRQVAQLVEKNTELTKNLTVLEAEIDSLKIRKTDLLQETDRLKSTIHERELRQTRLEAEREGMEGDLAQRHGLGIEEAIKYADPSYSSAELNNALKKLKTGILDLGEVNIAAIRQYDKFRERLDFLNTQRQDLLKAEDDISSLIHELDAKISDLFMGTFTQVQAHFSEIFRTLFVGGTAYLSLSKHEDIFESGIEIFAQPPGKRIQTLSLLSGGEKAMTAIALLFALLSVKPAPFCILDEIEAALDDVNIVRFAQYLSKLAEEMQFILITHRRETMEHAHSLYGVTIDTSGASRLISVNLNKANDKGSVADELA